MTKRTPNVLKFSMVYGDRSRMEGTLKCGDAQFNSLIHSLFQPEGFDAGLEQAFLATPTAETVKGDA